MARTDYPVDPARPGPLLVETAYTADQGSGWYSLTDLDPSVFDAAGAVTSTTADLGKFTDALFAGELVAPDMLAEMTAPRSDDGYGLGIFRLPDPCVPDAWFYGHDGGTFGTLSITLTSDDGERQLSVGLTGRDWVGDGTEEGALLTAALTTMLQATC